jgi:predicted RNA binding protein YcfA (HicA-like mRNA interferase family)
VFARVIIQEAQKIMKSYSSREVIAILKDDGWYKVGSDGSHHQFKHSIKIGKVTVKHPHKDIPIKTLKRIEEQSGVKFI